jgi:hypothetical protein
MATGPEHFKAAEELIAGVEQYGGDMTADGRSDQIAIAQVHATLAGAKMPGSVTFDVSGADEFHVLTQALEDYADKAAVMASREDASESFARWAAIADRMKAQAEAAAG